MAYLQENQREQSKIPGDSKHSIYLYYIFQFPISAYFMRNDENSIVRNILDKNN